MQKGRKCKSAHCSEAKKTVCFANCCQYVRAGYVSAAGVSDWQAVALFRHKIAMLKCFIFGGKSHFQWKCSNHLRARMYMETMTCPLLLL